LARGWRSPFAEGSVTSWPERWFCVVAQGGVTLEEADESPVEGVEVAVESEAEEDVDLGLEFGKAALERLGVLRSRSVEELLGRLGEDGEEVWSEAGGQPRVLTTGTERCSACRHPGHDRLLFMFWRGEISAEEAGAEAGVGADRWTQHIREHVPNYQVLRELAKLGGGQEMRRLLLELRDEALHLTDEFDRVTVLRRGMVVLQLQLMALLSRGMTTDHCQAAAVRGLVHEQEALSSKLEQAERAAAEWALEVRRERVGDGWKELERFKQDLSEILAGDPELSRRVNDRLHALEDARSEAGGEGSAPE